MAVVQSEGALVSAHRLPDYGYSGAPRRGVSLYSDRIESYRAIYRTQPNVRLVVRFLARNIGSLPLKLFERIDDTDRRQLRPADHPAAEWVRRPHPRSTRSRFIRQMVTDLAVFDEFLGLKMKNEASGKLRVVRLPPDLMEPEGSSWLEAARWTFCGNTARPSYEADDLVVIHGENLDDPRRGSSPMEALRRILAEDAAAGEWREQYWQGGARIAGVIERPLEAPEWGDDAAKRFSESWAAAYAGSDGSVSRTPVLEDGMSWKETTFSPRDSEYLAARRLSREEVAAQYGIDPVFVGILETATFASVKERHRNLYQDALGPWLDQITEELELQVLEAEYPDLTENGYLDFTLEEKLRGSFEEQIGAVSSAVGAPFLLRNEARALFNRPAVDGGDELVVPLNVIEGGQASPRDSAPPPGPPEPKAKAVSELPRELRGWRAAHEKLFERFFDRQGRTVLPRIGNGSDLDVAFDAARWDRELARDLLALSLEMFLDVADPVAKRFGGTVDPALARGYLAKNAEVAAENINQATLDAAKGALRGEGVRPGEGSALPADATDADLIREVFAYAVAWRAREAAVSRTTSVGSFAKHEAARQSGVRSKVWVVNASESRHSALAGETVPIGAKFSNGLRWPGDALGSASETAGCLCSLDFTTS